MPWHYADVDSVWFKPVLKCPCCGALPPYWRVGCQWEDCPDCTDYESSECAKCGFSIGGASYWELQLSHFSDNYQRGGEKED